MATWPFCAGADGSFSLEGSTEASAHTVQEGSFAPRQIWMLPTSNYPCPSLPRTCFIHPFSLPNYHGHRSHPPPPHLLFSSHFTVLPPPLLKGSSGVGACLIKHTLQWRQSSESFSVWPASQADLWSENWLLKHCCLIDFRSTVSPLEIKVVFSSSQLTKNRNWIAALVLASLWNSHNVSLKSWASVELTLWQDEGNRPIIFSFSVKV